MFGLLWLALALLCAAPAHAQREFGIGPAPAWVQRITPEPAPAVPAEQVSRGVHYLLSDVQTRVAADRVQYRHFAMKALDASGVDAIANIEIGFDPAYQRLTIHAIDVHRAGRVVSRLDASAIRVLQRERELEYRIFDGSKTANVFLDDVRVGDVVEYAFSVRGSNPVFGSRMFGGVELQWRAPVHHVYGRLLWPVGRDLHVANHKTDVRPAVRERGGEREYVWQAKDVPPLLVEDDAPGWYDPYPYVQWSEFDDWAAVARWAQPLYAVPAVPGAALQAEIDGIASTHATAADRVAAVLRFVQREIRYLGVEIGASSHAPSPPQLVHERRFGDCKDKTLLMVTMLRALGIDAQPALVNTRVNRAVNDLHPTPAAFNHVLVRVRLDGREHWLDPTRSPQKGSLASMVQSNHGYALVVDASTQGLTAMAQAPGSAFRRRIRAVLDATGGLDEPVRYTITSVLEGASAEVMRNTLAAQNRDELQKNYLNFYANYYDGVTVETPFTVTDDDAANRLTVTEQYQIARFWKRAEEAQRHEASIQVPDLDEYLRRPRERVRSAPLGLRHPVELTHVTEVRLPDGWKIEPDKHAVDDPAFGFKRTVAWQGRTLTLTDRFTSRADHVAPRDTERYVANLDRVRKEVGYVLFTNGAPASAPPGGWERMNWPVAMLAVMLLALWSWAATKVYRFDPPARAAPAWGAPSGIAGWLILPAIGLVVMPLRLAYQFAQAVPSYAVDTWSAVTTVGSAAYHWLWAPLLLFELGANLALLVFGVLLAVLFFQKRRSVPLLYIAVLGAAVLVQVIDLWLASSVPSAATDITDKDWRELGRSVASLAVWGSYFMLSKRVKATFVNGPPAKRQPAAVPAPAAG